MSRAVPVALQTHANGAATTLAWAIKITRRDAQVYAFTEHDRDQTIGGVLYRSAPGLDVQALVTSSGYGVDSTEASILADGVYFTKPDILAGRWDGAEFELFRYNWASPADGRDIRKVGWFGNVRAGADRYAVELHGLKRRLQQSIVLVTQPTCRNRLGDARCTVNLATGGRTVTGTLTHVTGSNSVRDAARAEAVDFFTDGELTMTSGDNSGLTFKVRAHAANGTLTLALPAAFAFQVGDAYSLIAGCRKRLAEDCIAKFANAVNFNGEPHVPGSDRVTSGT